MAYKAGQMLERPSQVEVEIPPPEPSSLIPEAIPLEILFENADLLVIDKPAGMVVHPAAGHSSGTLVHALLAYTPGLGSVGEQHNAAGQEAAAQSPAALRPGIVHRLDKETSGVLLVAKNDRAHQYLQDQFRLQKVTKIYLALVDGRPPTPSGRIEAAIGRDPGERKRLAIVSPQKGRQAISEYKTLEGVPWSTPGLSDPTRLPDAPTRFACTWRLSAARWQATASTGATTSACLWDGISCTRHA